MFCKDCKYWEDTGDDCYGVCRLAECESGVVGESYIVFMYDGCSYWRKKKKREEIIIL